MGITDTGRRPGGSGAARAGTPGPRPLVRAGDERGSILVMFAVTIVGFALLCAIVVDVGYWWVVGRKAQIAADACALAAASQLPAAWSAPPRSDCMISGLDYVKTNLPGDGLASEPRHLSTTVTSPFAAGAVPSIYVEAKVSVVVGTFFGRFAGLDYVTVNRRAVAEQSLGTPGDYAIYSHSASCSDGLEFNGSNHAINGRVHSNGQYLVANGGTQPFWAKAGTRRVTSCGPSSSPGTRFGGSSWSTGTAGLPVTDTDETWPEWFTPADFTCTVNAAKIEISGSDFKIDGVVQPYPTVAGQKVIPTGVYCATELFQINGDNIRGQLTALAPKIEVNGNNIDLTPEAPNNVLFYNLPNITAGGDGGPGGVPAPTCTFTNEMKLSNGNNSTWRGKVFHPCARVLIDGNATSSLEGAIYGLRVKVNGNGFNMVGTGGGGDATKRVALVQ